jgi:hypothetical protein
MPWDIKTRWVEARARNGAPSIKVRVTEEEEQVIKQKAQKLNMKVSDLLRWWWFLLPLEFRWDHNGYFIVQDLLNVLKREQQLIRYLQKT